MVNKLSSEVRGVSFETLHTDFTQTEYSNPQTNNAAISDVALMLDRSHNLIMDKNTISLPRINHISPDINLLRAFLSRQMNC